MSELKPNIHDEANGLDYVLAGDYYIPAIEPKLTLTRLSHWALHTSRQSTFFRFSHFTHFIFAITLTFLYRENRTFCALLEERRIGTI